MCALITSAVEVSTVRTSLVAYSDGRRVSDISEALRLAPTRAWNEGDPHPRFAGRKRESTHWEFDLGWAEGQYLSEQLARVAAQLAEVAVSDIAFAAVTSLSTTGDLAFFALSPALMRRLAAQQVRLELELLPPTDPAAADDAGAITVGTLVIEGSVERLEAPTWMGEAHARFMGDLRQAARQEVQIRRAWPAIERLDDVREAVRLITESELVAPSGITMTMEVVYSSPDGQGGLSIGVEELEALGQAGMHLRLGLARAGRT